MTVRRGKPQVGIFWIIGRRLVSFQEPVDEVKQVLGIKNSEYSHDPMWERVQRGRPKLAGKEYWEVPRGRLIYRVPEDRFVVYLPRRCAPDRRLVRRIARHFNLPPAKLDVVGDLHYDPPCDAMFDES